MQPSPPPRRTWADRRRPQGRSRGDRTGPVVAGCSQLPCAPSAAGGVQPGEGGQGSVLGAGAPSRVSGAPASQAAGRPSRQRCTLVSAPAPSGCGHALGLLRDGGRAHAKRPGHGHVPWVCLGRDSAPLRAQAASVQTPSLFLFQVLAETEAIPPNSPGEKGGDWHVCVLA